MPVTAAVESIASQDEELVESLAAEVAKVEYQETPARKLAETVASDLEKWKSIFPDGKYDTQMDRIINNLRERDRGIDPRSKSPELQADHALFEQIENQDKERLQLVFYEGYWDEVKTELNVLAGFLQEKPTREAAFAVYMYADCLTNPAAYHDESAFIEAARNFNLSEARFPDEKIASLYRSIQAVSQNRTVSFSEYMMDLEKRKSELNTSSDFEAMRARYQTKREPLVKFIEEVDSLIPWEPGENSWQHLEEVPGGWTEDWLGKVVADAQEVSNPYNVSVEVDGKILFIPYSQEQYATIRTNLVYKEIRIKTPSGAIRTVEVPFLDEQVLVRRHRSEIMGTALGTAVPGGKDKVFTVKEADQCFSATNIVDTTERLQQYAVAKQITPELLAKLKSSNASESLITQVEWCLKQNKTFFLRPELQDGKWKAVVVHTTKREEVMDSLQTTINALNHHGFTYKDAMAEKTEAAAKQQREVRVKQRIETYIPRNETMVEVERAGLYIQHEMDAVLEALNARGNERDAHIIAQIEAAKTFVNKQYSEFNFLYGKPSYYEHLAMERILERARLGLIDLTEAEMRADNPKWQAYINAEVQKIHYELSFKAMALKNMATEVRRLGTDLESLDDFDLLRYANMALVIDRQWRKDLYMYHYAMDENEATSKLDRLHSLALCGRYAESGHIPATFDQVEHALDLATQRMTYWEIHKIMWDAPERENIEVPEVWITFAIRIVEELRSKSSHPERIPVEGTIGYDVLIRKLSTERYLRAINKDLSQVNFPTTINYAVPGGETVTRAPVEIDSPTLVESLTGYFDNDPYVEPGITPPENINWYEVATTYIGASGFGDVDQSIVNALAAELQRSYRDGVIAPPIVSILQNMKIDDPRPGSWVIEGENFIEVLDSEGNPINVNTVSTLAPTELPEGDTLSGFEGTLEEQAYQILSMFLEHSENDDVFSALFQIPLVFGLNANADNIIETIVDDLQNHSPNNPPTSTWWTAYTHLKSYSKG